MGRSQEGLRRNDKADTLENHEEAAGDKQVQELGENSKDYKEETKVSIIRMAQMTSKKLV